MPTGQSLINAALTSIGMLEQGGVPSTSDSVDSLSKLNSLWDAAGIDEGLIYAVTVFSGPLTTAVPSYTIGSGGVFDTQRPSRIYRAHYVLGNNRNELDIIDSTRYYSHNDLSASAATPDELYPEWAVDSTGPGGLVKLFLWPVPAFGAGNPTLELEQAVQFVAWTLDDDYFLPQGYQDALEEMLAFRLLSRFGAAVEQAVAVLVTANAQKAEARIRAMNAINRKLPPGADAAPQAQPVAAGARPGA